MSDGLSGADVATVIPGSVVSVAAVDASCPSLVSSVEDSAVVGVGVDAESRVGVSVPLNK